MGDIITNPPTTPNTVSDSWQPLVDRDTMSYFGKNKITLTNWDASTTAPAIAQGSTIDINGSIARFTVDEAIGGAPADGTVYLMFVVSGSTVTAEWTAEFPTWTANKGGWYTVAGNRCSGHNAVKAGTAFSNKSRFSDDDNGDSLQILAADGVYIESLYNDDMTVSGTATIETLYLPKRVTLSSITMSPSGIYILPAGIHEISYDLNDALGGVASSVVIEILISGTWRYYFGVSVPTDQATIISNGLDYRLRNANSSESATVRWAQRA